MMALRIPTVGKWTWDLQHCYLVPTARYITVTATWDKRGRGEVGRGKVAYELISPDVSIVRGDCLSHGR